MNTAINVLSLFDGISVGQLSLQRAGIKVGNYLASEIDKNAIEITQKNFPNTTQLGPVENIDLSTLPHIDLLLGGSPCQGFSFAGNKLNFDDPRSKLLLEYVRIKNEVNPRWWLLENVPMKKEWQNIISEMVGVQPVKMNSSLVSAQNRERLYWTNIPFEKPDDRGIMLESIVGEYDGIWIYPRGWNKGGTSWYKGKSPTITVSSWQYNFFIVLKDGTKRKFCPEEVEQIQTLPINYTSGIKNGQRYKLIGNCWTCDMIVHILNGILDK